MPAEVPERRQPNALISGGDGLQKKRKQPQENKRQEKNEFC